MRTALAALAAEPVSVVATTNGVAPQTPIEVPANALLVDWLSYSQLMPAAALVISHGGHGTVARALGAGTPVLICPIVGDMSETAMRVSWAGAGLSLPWRLCRPAPLRWSVRRLLEDPSYAARAGSWPSGAASTTVPGEAPPRRALATRPRLGDRLPTGVSGEKARGAGGSSSSGGGTRTHNPAVNSPACSTN